MSEPYLVKSYSAPREVLSICLQALTENPKIKSIILVPEGFALSAQTEAQVIEALDEPNIAMVQLLGLQGNQRSNHSCSNLDIAFDAKSSVCAIHASLIQDYATKFIGQYGLHMNLSDISIALNQLGFSTATVYQRDLIPQLVDSKRIKRSWDPYVAHIQQHLKDETRIEAFKSTQHYRGIPFQILIDCEGLERRHNGTSRLVTSIIHELVGISDFDVVLNMSRATQAFFDLEHVKNIENCSLEQQFDLVLALTPLRSFERLLRLSEVGRTLAVLHLDLIAIRNLEHLSQRLESRSVVDLYLRFADKIFFISNAAQNDACAYYQLDVSSIADRFKVIHLGVAESFLEAINQRPQTLLPSEYVLILGNSDKHKQVQLAAQTLIDAGYRVVTLGGEQLEIGQHLVFQAGTLSDGELRYIIEKSEVTVFPSLQEGFGLPILEVAALGKPLVVWDIPASTETLELVRETANIRVCSSMQQLPRLVSEVLGQTQTIRWNLRPLSAFSRELCSEIDLMLQRDSDPINMIQRKRVLSWIRDAQTAQRLNNRENSLAKRLLMEVMRKLSTVVRRYNNQREVRSQATASRTHDIID